ncbi:unnamed protein product [Adineta steineri]|uniref:Uncharacterized protein n=1 Tax=Adineta steineri TaxID=433720 RepID=A0A815LMC1_9BILA|nr:unnamed protein product [Adineta steineri]
MGTFIFQALSAFCQLSNQIISNRLIQLNSSQYVTASVAPLQVFQSQTQAFISQFISSITNDFLLSISTIRNTTQSNNLLTGQLTNYYLVRQSNNYVYSSSSSYGNCSCATSAICGYESPIYDLKTSNALFIVPGIYTGCYIIEALLQSNLQCFYNQTCINKIQSYFTKYLSMNLTTLDVSLLVQFHMNSKIQELVDNLMVEEWNNSTGYDGYYRECQPSKCSYTYQTKNDLNSSQYVTASVAPLQVFQSQTQAFISQFISSITNDFLLSISTIRNTTQSNNLLTGQLTNYYLVRQSNNYVYSSSSSYGNCSCATSAICGYESPIYDLKTSNALFIVPGIYTGCYIIEALLQSNLQCFYNQTCINKIQSYFTKYLSMNLTTLDVSLLVQFHMNSKIQELVDNLMVEEWNNSTGYDGYYRECQPSKCSYTYQTKNDCNAEETSNAPYLLPIIIQSSSQSLSTPETLGGLRS